MEKMESSSHQEEIPKNGKLADRMAMVASTPAAATLGGWGRVQTAVTVELLSFTGPGSENCCDVVVDNASSWKTELYDRATSEHIKFLYAVVTTKDAEGDLKLARLCRLVEEAGLHIFSLREEREL